jgi:hypothetical protein
MMLSIVDGYGDAGFFHELGHYLMATEEQRQYPDFALGQQTNNGMTVFTSNTTPHVFTEETSFQPKGHNTGWGEDTIPISEATRQEGIACDLLGIYEPLCGVWSWKEQDTDLRISRAAGDFGAFDFPDNEVDKRAETLYDELVVKINPRIKKRTVVDYCLRYFGPQED